MATVKTLIGNIKGPQGEQGPQGPQGKVGATFVYDEATKTLNIITE